MGVAGDGQPEPEALEGRLNGVGPTGGAARSIGCDKRGGARNPSHLPGGGAGGNLDESGVWRHGQ